MTIVAVFLAPLVGLGLIVLLEHVEEWAFQNDQRIDAARPGATSGGSTPQRPPTQARPVL